MVAIYMLCDPRTGEVRYIGMSRNPAIRLRQYRAQGGGHTKHLRHWLESIDRNPQQIILEHADLAVADQCERRWIALLRSYETRLINYTHGGEGGFDVPDEHKARLRALRQVELDNGTHNFLRPEVRARTTATNRRKGIPHPWSVATIKKVNEARAGKPLTGKALEHARTVWIGRKHAPESIERMRQVSRDRWNVPGYREQVMASMRAHWAAHPRKRTSNK